MGDVGRASKAFFENRLDPAALDLLNSYRRFRLNCLQTSLRLIREACPPRNVLMSARLKRLTSVYRKMRRSHKSTPINQMDDIIGFRIICQTLRDVERFGIRLRSRLQATIKDYLVEEHSVGIGYRAIHGVVRFDQPLQEKSFRVRFEVQIRTWYQHLWACWCESHGEQAKEGFINVVRDDDVEKKKLEFRACSNAVKSWEISHPEYVQNPLPHFSDPYNIAIAWLQSKRNHSFAPFFNDLDRATNYLNYLEAQSDIQPLLLIGIADEQNLQTLLTQTHPNFLSSSSLDPQYWLPG